MSEACCFGLGAGLGITYVELPGSDTPFIVHVRSMGFEEKVFKTLAVPFAWTSYSTKLSASTALHHALQENRPALLLTDIYHLPYFGSSTHFPGHAIVAWLLDMEREEVLVSDTERPEFIAVPVGSLAEARFSTSPPFIHHGSMFAPHAIDTSVTSERVRKALYDNACSLANGNRFSGLEALDTWVAALPRWAEEGNWHWSLRFAYQVIEKRGTGGAGFRAMYAEFLEEASEILPAVGSAKLVELMRGAAASWSDLASVLKMGSESTVFPLTEIERAIQHVRTRESQYVQRVLDVFS